MTSACPRAAAGPAAVRPRRVAPRRLLPLMLALMTWAAAGPTTAHGAEFGIESFTTSVTDADGIEDTRAAGHPYQATTSFSFTTRPGTGQDAQYGNVPVEDPKDIVTELPPGFVGNPQAAPTCGSNQMRIGRCPVDSQVGVAAVRFAGTSSDALDVPVYNLQPTPGHPAMLGFVAGGAGEVTLFPRVRSDGDYGLSIVAPYNQQYAVVEATLTFWGYPADDRHDAERFTCFFGSFCSPGTPTDAPLRPFLTAPATECTPRQPMTRLRVNSWQNPGRVLSAEAASPALTGCDRLTFEPSAAVAPTTSAPDAPTGLGVTLAFPQEDSAEGLAPPALKKATVTFPEGMTINPSGANGLEACSDADLKLRSLDPVGCQNASKVGTVTAKSPLLAEDEELTGGIYIRSQDSSDPESGEMFRIALVLENEERGLSIRLPGQIRANKDTGRLETTFDNNPELPVSELHLRFKGGPTAPLATPPTCGEKTVDTRLTSWGGQTADRRTSFGIDCTPGLGGFAPSFAAGAVDPTAAAASPFVLHVAKPDGNADLDGLRLQLPTGLLATIKGNLGTRVGTATIAAGPGTTPYWLSGPVVLEGAYGDAPYSLRVTVPAKAGPFDLGDVVVRQRIYVDPDDAHVTIVSDPLPTIVKGVPVRMQRLDVAVDKPGFMRNPTSCAEKTLSGALGAVGGRTAAVSSRFQVGGCEGLPLRPELALRLDDPKAMTLGKHPPFTATVRQGGRQSNLRSVEVTLPPTVALEADNAEALCTPEQAAAKACPEASVVGSASAETPLLEERLSGKVFFVKGTRRTASGKVIPTLPKLWVALRGAIAVDLWADTATKNGARPRLVTTFGRVPDVPISSFVLKIAGGEHGILVVSSSDERTNLCRSVQRADAVMDGHNGKRRTTRPAVATACGFRAQEAVLGPTRARVRMSGIGAGRLRLSGPGVRTTSRTVRGATSALVSAPLTSAGRRTWAGGRTVRGSVVFTPRTGKVRRLAVTLRPPARKGR